MIDLVSDSNKIIAEVKNKFNTITFGKLSDLYFSLDNLISPKTSIYKDYTAYYVAIVPKNGLRYNKPFTPSINKTGKKCPVNENIREIDGASFYSLVTGNVNALEELFYVLPEIIQDCSEGHFHISNKEKIFSFFSKAYRK
ncbi:MAG: Eco47II family restriction endonuclease [Bacteroidales bacterium]|nr:Eco47II family restriction endonuclease [Bacteroidales bacterium]